MVTEEQRKLIDFRMMSKPRSICSCGHTGDGVNSQHGLGHQNCLVKGCACPRFTWADFTPEMKESIRVAQAAFP